MENNLKRIRQDSKISLKQLEEYVSISNANLSLIENQKRPFRQWHIDLLTSFFQVSSDYLLGKSDYGIVVHNENGDELILTSQEYADLIGKVSKTIIKLGDETNIVNVGGKKIIVPKYCVYRDFTDRLREYDLTPILTNKLNNLVKRMTSQEIEKTINFIEQYIL